MIIIDIAYIIFSVVTVVMFLIPITGIFVAMPIMYLTPLLDKLEQSYLVWADKHGQFRANWALFFSIGCVVWFLVFLVLYTNLSALSWFISTLGSLK
jgi:hypothetical protein